jgi:hypothetical protein
MKTYHPPTPKARLSDMGRIMIVIVLALATAASLNATFVRFVHAKTIQVLCLY